MIAVRAPFCVAGKSAVLQPPISKEGKTSVTDMLFVRFSNMAINDQVTVNPPVPATVLKLRV